MNWTIDEQFLQQTLIDLVQINSVNPSLTPEGAGETEIAHYVADVLTRLGLAVTTYELAPDRWNVIGHWPGRGQGHSLLWNAHLDTVGVEGMVEPFAATIRNGRLYGRGSQDMKGSLAAMLAAIKGLIDGGVSLAGDVWLTAVADEEYTSIGTADLVKRVTADAAIVTEPTDLTLCRAHRGFIWYEVETIGRAAHGSRYQEGIDANIRMGRFLAELDQLEQQLRQRPPHPLVGPPSLHAALLKGGTEISKYAARCQLKLERRTNPGEEEAGITQELQAIVDGLAATDPTFEATVLPFFRRQPFEVEADADIVKVVETAMTSRLGQPPRHTGQTFWTDAALLAEAGMETVLIGPTGAGLHSVEEWVDLQSVLDLAYILAESATIYCR